MSDSPTYLGDGLYADYDGYRVELYSSNGMEKISFVFLEPPVLANFLRYIEKLKGGGKAADAD